MPELSMLYKSSIPVPIAQFNHCFLLYCLYKYSIYIRFTRSGHPRNHANRLFVINNVVFIHFIFLIPVYIMVQQFNQIALSFKIKEKKS